MSPIEETIPATRGTEIFLIISYGRSSNLTC